MIICIVSKQCHKAFSDFIILTCETKIVANCIIDPLERHQKFTHGRQNPNPAFLRVWTRDLHGDGNCGNPAEPAGIPRGWKLMSWDSRGMEQNFAGFPRECSFIWLLWCTFSNKSLFSNSWVMFSVILLTQIIFIYIYYTNRTRSTAK